MIGILNTVQCAVVTFVDDIINRVAANDINQLKIKTEEINGVIEKKLTERNVYLNNNKEQSIWRFHGTGSWQPKLSYTQSSCMALMNTLGILAHNLKNEEDAKLKSQYVFKKHKLHGITTRASGPRDATYR